MHQLKIFIELTRLNKPIGYMLLFWPCSWGLALAHYYNENEKFHEREVEVHICFSLMEMSGMTKMDGIPCFCFGNNKH